MRTKNFVGFAILVSTALIAVGSYGQSAGDHLPGRPNQDLGESLDLRIQDNPGLNPDCLAGFLESEYCATSENPEVLLWGDSFAAHLALGFVSSNPDIKMVQKTVGSCGPILGIAPVLDGGLAWSRKCLDFNDKVLSSLERTPSIKFVVLSSVFWQYLGDDAMVLTETGEVVEGNQVTLTAMNATIEEIKALGAEPIIFSPPPQSGKNIGRCLAKAVLYEKDIEACDFAYARTLETQSEVWDFLDAISLGSRVVNIPEVLCRDGLCRASIDGVFIYNSLHLSREGSIYLGEKMNFYQIATVETDSRQVKPITGSSRFGRTQ